MPASSFLTRMALAAGSKPRSRKLLPTSTPATGLGASMSFLSCTRSPAKAGIDRLFGSNTPAPVAGPFDGRAVLRGHAPATRRNQESVQPPGTVAASTHGYASGTGFRL